VAAHASPVDFVIFPQYRPEAPETLTPLPRAAAALELVRGTFNPRDFRAELVPLLARLVRGATCYTLTTQAPTATARLLEQLVARSAPVAGLHAGTPAPLNRVNGANAAAQTMAG
jgi:hypothetical protein